MQAFELRLRRAYNKYDGTKTTPRELELVCGNKVLASISMFELKEALDEVDQYLNETDTSNKV